MASKLLIFHTVPGAPFERKDREGDQSRGMEVTVEPKNRSINLNPMASLYKRTLNQYLLP